MSDLVRPQRALGTHLVLGEGDRDCSFLKALCQVRGIEGLEFDHVRGNPKFGDHLAALTAQSDFSKRKAILLVSDNDESANKSFAFIKTQLNDSGFPSPTRPLEIAKKLNLPALGVLMLPYPDVDGSSNGCLETLLIPAMEAAHAIEAACVNQLMLCASVATWPKKSSRDKLKVRCLISTFWKDDPMHGLNYCFSPLKGIIPLDHSIFDGVAEVLRHFEAWANSDIKAWADWKAAQKIP
jgi:hypothetical protein